MNKNKYVAYTQGVTLKNLGYDEPCDAVFGYNCQDGYPTEIKERIVDILEISLTEGCIMGQEDLKNSIIGEDISAPTLSDALDWMEKKHNLVYEIGLDKTAEPKYYFEIHRYEDFGNYKEIKADEWFLYRTRRETKSECLSTMLKYLIK